MRWRRRWRWLWRRRRWVEDEVIGYFLPGMLSHRMADDFGRLGCGDGEVALQIRMRRYSNSETNDISRLRLLTAEISLEL